MGEGWVTYTTIVCSTECGWNWFWYTSTEYAHYNCSRWWVRQKWTKYWLQMIIGAFDLLTCVCLPRSNAVTYAYACRRRHLFSFLDQTDRDHFLMSSGSTLDIAGEKFEKVPTQENHLEVNNTDMKNACTELKRAWQFFRQSHWPGNWLRFHSF